MNKSGRPSNRMADARAMTDKIYSEKKSVIYVVAILISVCLLATVIIVWKLKSFDAGDICSTRECLKSSVFLLDILATDLDPCDNFYNFTCGNYKGHLLVYNFQQGIDKYVRDFITSPIQNNDSRSVKLQKKYYQACMDITGIEEDQNETLKKLYEKLGGWPVLKGNSWKEDAFDWGKIVETSKDIGFYYDWFINIKNFEESLYENRLYVTVPDNVNEIESGVRKKYVTLMTNVAVILGAPGNVSNISQSMNRVMEFEMGLSKIIQDSQLNTTHQKYTMEEIQYKYPNMPWSALFKYVILPRNEKIIFNSDSYIPKLETYLNTTEKRVQADYIFWKLTESFSALLSYAIRKEFENFADIDNQYIFPKDRANYCYGITNTVFAYVSEAEFVRKYTIEKKSIKEMVDRISLVLRKHIENVKWMNEVVKNVAYSKLSNMTIVIGGPEEMYLEEQFDKFLGIDQINLSGLNSTIEIICEVDRSRDLFNLDFRKPKLNVKEAQLYQGVTNIGFIKYMPDENVMFLPAAALDGLFYSPDRQNYLNYGAIGTIIGHELAHGFGLLGNLGLEKVLHINDSLEKFLEAAKCLVEDCNNIGVENTINELDAMHLCLGQTEEDGEEARHIYVQKYPDRRKLDRRTFYQVEYPKPTNEFMHCRKTFEENFADYAGINLSYEAYMDLEEYHGKESSLPGLDYNSKQLFWIIYSSVMCNNIDVNNTEGYIHMLPFQRILGAFRNSEHFAKDFNCPIGSNMNPKVKCKIL